VDIFLDLSGNTIPLFHGWVGQATKEHFCTHFHIWKKGNSRVSDMGQAKNYFHAPFHILKRRKAPMWK